MTVGELRASMSYREFVQWAALYEEEQDPDAEQGGTDDKVIAAMRNFNKGK